MQLTGKTTTPSQVDPSVKFTVKHLNSIQRAKRDMGILEQNAKIQKIEGQRQDILKSIYGTEKDEEKRKGMYAAAPDAKRAECSALYDEAEALSNMYIMPAMLRAGLMKIEGLIIEGAQIETAEALIENAPDALLDEAIRLCKEASGMTVEQQKN